MKKIMRYALILLFSSLFLGACQLTADPIEELQTEGEVEGGASRGSQHPVGPPD